MTSNILVHVVLDIQYLTESVHAAPGIPHDIESPYNMQPLYIIVYHPIYYVSHHFQLLC